MIKVLLVDDQKIIREGLKMILALDSEIEIIAEGENGEEAVLKNREFKPDVILMDIRMPRVNGVEAIKRIKEESNVKILVLTTFNEDEYIFESLKYGAKGYLLKDAEPEEIISGVKNIAKGNMLISSEVASKLPFVFESKERKIEKLNGLTEREREVTKLILEGLNNKEIGENLFISEGTVKNYVSKILDKLEYKSRAELISNLK